jgi:asparagine synthase (glutamine-hydrolysing)
MTKVDVASMAHSLEVRAPFLDHRFVESALAVPTGWKLRGWHDKHILRAAFADLIPGPIARRGKQGFAVPLGAWFRGELSGLLDELLLSREARTRDIFRPREVRRLVEEHRTGQAGHEHRLWALLFLEMWCRMTL